MQTEMRTLDHEPVQVRLGWMTIYLMVYGLQSAFQLAEMQTHSPWTSPQFAFLFQPEDSSLISENKYKTM